MAVKITTLPAVRVSEKLKKETEMAARMGNTGKLWPDTPQMSLKII